MVFTEDKIQAFHGLLVNCLLVFHLIYIRLWERFREFLTLTDECYYNIKHTFPEIPLMSTSFICML